MSVSVGSSYSNPYAYLQYLLQQNASSSATAGQTDAAAADPLAQSPSGTAASYSNSTASAMLVNSSAQFGPQTFFALLGMQETGNGSPSEMPWSQPGTGDTSGDNDAASAGQSSGWSTLEWPSPARSIRAAAVRRHRRPADFRRQRCDRPDDDQRQRLDHVYYHLSGRLDSGDDNSCFKQRFVFGQFGRGRRRKRDEQ